MNDQQRLPLLPISPGKGTHPPPTVVHAWCRRGGILDMSPQHLKRVAEVIRETSNLPSWIVDAQSFVDVAAGFRDDPPPDPATKRWAARVRNSKL